MSSGTLPLSTYHRAQSLGCGTFGSVVTVYDADGEEFALKLFLDDDEDDDSSVDEGAAGVDVSALREISILRILRDKNGHENVVQIVDVKSAEAGDGGEEYGAGTEGCVGMAMPVYHGGTLEDAINNGTLRAVDRRIKIQIAHGMLCAVAFCHDNGIIHRDIKANNVMLSNPICSDDGGGGPNPVLIDFSLAKLVNGTVYGSCSTGGFNGGCGGMFTVGGDTETEATHTGEVGTVAYTAPEVVAKKPYGLKSDLWSVGVILLEMIRNGTLPVEKDKEAARMVEDAKVKLPDQPFANLVRGLLEVDPNKRLSAREALESKVFARFGLEVPEVKMIDMGKALPLEGHADEESKENSRPTPPAKNGVIATTPGTKGRRVNNKKKIDPVVLKRQKIIRRICHELECSHPLTPHAALEYAQLMYEQLDDNLDDIASSQTLLDCVILADKFFEPELRDLHDLEEEGGGSFEGWSLDEYVDNETTIWMLMDHCLYPRKLVEWEG